MSNTLIHPYLFFAGRCEEAIEHYKNAIGAKVQFLMRFRDSPEPHPDGALPEGSENKIMHATLTIDGAILMASDGLCAEPSFDGFRVSLAFATEARADEAFKALAEGGSVQMPLGKTFWSPCFGMVTDRFGVGWMISTSGDE